jgi:hypothetical protein
MRSGLFIACATFFTPLRLEEFKLRFAEKIVVLQDANDLEEVGLFSGTGDYAPIAQTGRRLTVCQVLDSNRGN